LDKNSTGDEFPHNQKNLFKHPLILFQARIAQLISQQMLKAPWLLILAGLHLVGWLARRITYDARSLIAQYGGLAIYIVAKTIIIMPLLYLANKQVSGVIQNAAQLR
jgi:hypothetical protein